MADKLVTRALNSVARLETSVAGALRVARRGQTPATEIDLCPVIRVAAEVVGGTMASIPATMDLHLPLGGLPVRGDAGALQQLFSNLLFNAAQALRPGGMTRVVATEAGGFADVAIVDTGTGMSANDLAQLENTVLLDEAERHRLGVADCSANRGNARRNVVDRERAWYGNDGARPPSDGNDAFSACERTDPGNGGGRMSEKRATDCDSAR